MKFKLQILIYTLLALIVNQRAIAQTWSSVEQTTLIKISGITLDNQISSLTADQKQVINQYTDGLGRVIQSVAVQASPLHKDIIQPVIYNTLGQQVKSLLPYTDGDSTGNFRANVNTAQRLFTATAQLIK